MLTITLAPVLLVCLLVAAEEILRARRRWAILAAGGAGFREPVRSWPGIRAGCAGVGMALVLLLCYQLALPVSGFGGWHRVGAVVRAAAAFACAWAVLVQVHRIWSAGLADIALGLITLGVCTLAVELVPDQPRALDARYPLLFNALVFALGAMTWFWTWLAGVWEQQREDSPAAPRGSSGQRAGSAEVRSGDPAWTTAGRLVPVNRRFSLVTAAAGLAVAVLMGVWPALRNVSADDDSLGRVSAGVAGHLLLLLACVWCARRAARKGFSLLSILVVLSMVAFVAVRARWFVS